MIYFLWNTILFAALLGVGHDITISQVYAEQPPAFVGFEVLVAYVLWLRMRGELRRLRLLNKTVAPVPVSPLQRPQDGPITSL